MSDSKPPKPLFAVKLDEIKDRRYHHAIVSVLVWDNQAHCWRNASDGCDNLQARDQADSDLISELSYAWSIGYHDLSSVDYRRAKQMAETLRPIEAKLKRMEEVEGPAATFGIFALRFARAVGAKNLIRFHGHSPWYDKDEWDTLPLTSIVWHIDQMNHAWHEEHQTPYYRKMNPQAS